LAAVPPLHDDDRMQTYIEIPEAARGALLDVLDKGVATSMQLQLLCKMAHWNCRGPEFVGLHQLFDEIADRLCEQADTLAERAVAIGGYVECDAATIAEKGQTEAFDEPIIDGLNFADELAGRLAERAIALRHAIREVREHDDPATEHVLAEILAATEKDVWMLESHLRTFDDDEEDEVEDEAEDEATRGSASSTRPGPTPP
jgi:starvation-inducible DNA-binding protein